MSKKYPSPKNTTFYDPETGNVKCTYEECKKKFSIKKAIWVLRERKHDLPYWRQNYFHECNECGQKYITNADRQKNIYGKFGGTGEKPSDLELPL